MNQYLPFPLMQSLSPNHSLTPSVGRNDILAYSGFDTYKILSQWFDCHLESWPFWPSVTVKCLKIVFSVILSLTVNNGLFWPIAWQISALKSDFIAGILIPKFWNFWSVTVIVLKFLILSVKNRTNYCDIWQVSTAIIRIISQINISGLLNPKKLGNFKNWITPKDLPSCQIKLRKLPNYWNNWILSFS